ncbi:MAG: hypothetical protein ACJZ8O_09930 [Pirellulaceae bacterium]
MSQDGTNSDILRKAESLIAEHSGLTPEVIIRIRQICADKGWSRSETDELLSGLGGKPKAVNELPAAQQPFQRSSSSFTHANAGLSNQDSLSLNSSPLTDAVSQQGADPGEIFLDWVKLEILTPPRLGVSSEVISALFSRGIQELRLSDVYASQLIVNACEFYNVDVPSYEGQIALPVKEVQSDKDAIDPIVVGFVDRIREVIATHQGVNLQSRIKIDMEAKQRGLTQEQRQLGLSLAVNGPVSEAETDEHLEQRIESFRIWARSIVLLQQREGRILASLIESMATEAAPRYGISREHVHECIEQISSSIDIHIVHDDDAMENFRQGVVVALDDGVSITSTDQQGLIVKAMRMGLSEDVAQIEIQKVISANQSRAQSEHSKTRGVLTTVAISALLAVAMIVYVIVKTLDSTGEVITQVIDTNQTSGDTIVGQPVPKWWDGDLRQDITSLVESSRSFTQSVSLVTKEQDDLRMVGYDQLVAAVFDNFSTGVYVRPSQAANGQFTDQQSEEHNARQDKIARIISACIVHEPSESNSKRLVEKIMNLIDLDFVEIKQEDLLACKSMWAIDVLSQAWQFSSNLADKQAVIADEIQNQIGITPLVGDTFDESGRRLTEAVRQNLIGELINQIQFSPDLAAAELVDLLLLQQRLLPDSQWQSDVMRVLQLANPESLLQWQIYRPLYKQCIEMPQASTVIGLIKLFRNLDSDSIRNDVLGDLSTITGHTPDRTASPEEVTWEFFKAFSISHLKSENSNDETARWLAQADRTVARQSVIPASEEAMFDVIAYMQFNSALGSSLIFDESLYQEMSDERPHPLTPSPDDSNEPNGGRGLVGTINLLSNATTDEQKSDLYLAMMQEDNLKALPSGHATSLAVVLLQNQSVDIGSQILEMAGFFRTSPFLLANLSSLIRPVGLTNWHRDLVHALINQPLAESEPNDWCLAAKSTLLAIASDGFQDVRRGLNNSKVDFIEDATALLCDRYMNVLRLAAGSGQRPGQKMNQIAHSIINRELAMQSQSDEVSGELAALELALESSESDIELYVLNVRCVSRCLGYSISAIEPMLKEIIDARLRRLELKLQTSKSIKEQLYFVEHSVLEMWMIRVIVGELET